MPPWAQKPLQWIGLIALVLLILYMTYCGGYKVAEREVLQRTPPAAQVIQPPNPSSRTPDPYELTGNTLYDCSCKVLNLLPQDDLKRRKLYCSDRGFTNCY
jgi:hypothetical protein